MAVGWDGGWGGACSWRPGVEGGTFKGVCAVWGVSAGNVGMAWVLHWAWQAQCAQGKGDGGEGWGAVKAAGGFSAMQPGAGMGWV